MIKRESDENVIYIFILFISVWFGGCESTSDILPYNYIETTQEGSATFVLKGYETPDKGFNVFEPKGFDDPFYLKEKK